MTKSLESTRFLIAKMDCPSEEGIIRMALRDVAEIRGLEFDLAAREIRVLHTLSPEEVLDRLSPLRLDASILESEQIKEDDTLVFAQQDQEAGDLKLLLLINGLMFILELIAGVIAESAGLIADSLDMLADASVYGLAFLMVYQSREQQRNIARVSGWLQALLALGVLMEVARRLVFGSEPVSMLMMTMGGIALAANVLCLSIIHKHRAGGLHMQASWIFSANDVIANAGVIVAGGLVLLTQSHLPDLVVGAIIGLVVLNGAQRILALVHTGS
ncbi:MAG: cation transporter [Gammaproteobacteria bacterium]